MFEDEDEGGGGDVVVDDEHAPTGAAEPDAAGADGKEGDAAETPAAEDGAASPEADVEAKPDPIDALLDPNRRPTWAKELLERAAEADADLGVTAEELNEMPIEAQRTVVNLLRRAEQAQAALRTAEQKILDDRKKNATEARKVERARADVLSWTDHPLTKAFMERLKPGEGEDRLDPDSPEGRKAAVRAEARELFEQFFGAIRQVGEKRKEEATAAERTEQAQTRKEQIGAYMEQHADDFKDPVILDKIKALMREATPPGAKGSALSVERAHKLAVAELAIEGNADASALARARAQARVRKGGGGGQRVPATPKFADIHDEEEFYRNHPDAVQRDLDEAMRSGLLV